VSSSAGVPFGIFTVDAALVVRTWHPWLAQVKGRAAADVIGQPLTSLAPDLDGRGLLPVFERVLALGSVEILATALHHHLIPCPPSVPIAGFDLMRQRVTIGPIREAGRIAGAVITIEDVTARVAHERDLARRLADPDVQVRRAAAQALGEAKSHEAIAPLGRALGDEDTVVRRAAVAGLAAYGQDIVHSLIATLRQQHGDFNVLSSALDLLAVSDVDVIEPIAECLRSEDVDLRIQAALILGERRDRRAVQPLLAALDDADVNVRFHAIEALGRLQARETAEHLVRVAEGGDFFLAFPAIQALATLRDPTIAPRLVPLLADEMLRTPAVEALGKLADDAVVPALVDLLNRRGTPTEVIADALSDLHERLERRYGTGDHVLALVRRTVDATGTQSLLDALERVSGDRLAGLTRVLGWLDGPAAQRALTRLLGQPAVRAHVVEALVRHGAGVVDLLVEQLRSEDLDIRQAAAVALGRIGDRRAVGALIEALADRELALPAAGALARIGAAEAFEPLLALIGHPDVAVRQAIVAALNSIGHPEMPARIAARLDDPDPLVRESSVRIAGYFGYPECFEQVLARCSDPSEEVRRAAVEHLPFFDDHRAAAAVVAMLERDTPRVRAAAAGALARIEAEWALPALTGALRDRDAWVRYFAVRALGIHRNPATADLVIERLEQDEAGQVRLAAIEVLGQLHAPHALGALMPLASATDVDVARAAISAIGQSDRAEAGVFLETLVRSREPWRRLAAAAVIAGRGDTHAAATLQWMAGADADESVAAGAIAGLARLASATARGNGAVRALVALLEEPSRREQAIATLAALPQPAIAAIVDGLTHASPEVRRGTIEALGRMRRAEASQALEAALDDPVPSVRTAAITELRRLGSIRAGRKLLSLARTDPDADVRQAAVLAVARTALPTELDVPERPR
jgi:HEAT repeat protein